MRYLFMHSTPANSHVFLNENSHKFRWLSFLKSCRSICQWLLSKRFLSAKLLSVWSSMPTAFLLCLVSSFCPSNLSGLHLYKARVPLVASPLLPLYRFLLDHDTRPVFCCCRSWLVFEVEAKTKPGNHVYFNILCIGFPPVISS